jgi:putative transposase
MPNHVHLLVTPPDAVAVGHAMQAIGRRYVRWFNDRHARTGALFEGRYRSTVVEADRYLLACMRYIELNPVRAGIVQRPEQFPWSSYRHHVGLVADPDIADHPLYWSLGNTPFERQAAYMRLFEQEAGAGELDRIRAATHGGWALGERGFATEIAKRTKRRPLREEPAGPGPVPLSPIKLANAHHENRGQTPIFDVERLVRRSKSHIDPALVRRADLTEPP